jgi:hypothetical protein
MASTPEYEAGQEYTQKDGCGALCVNFRDGDVLKRMTLELELCTRDIELISLLTGATIHYDDSETPAPIGFSRRPGSAGSPPKVAVEVWTRNVSSAGLCTVTTTAPYTRVIWPAAEFTLGEQAFANEVATVRLTGFGEGNPLFTDGCWNDVPSTITLDPDSPEHSFYDDELPTLGCGFTVAPVPSDVPVVSAGADASVVLPAVGNLVGTVSDDEGGVTQLWTKISGPGTVTFGTASAVTTTATFSVAGVYVLRLTATDTDTQTAYDEVTITVTGP